MIRGEETKRWGGYRSGWLPLGLLIAVAGWLGCDDGSKVSEPGDGGPDGGAADGGADGDSDADGDLCSDVHCSGRGTCSVVDGKAVCACEDGFYVEGDVECLEIVPTIQIVIKDATTGEEIQTDEAEIYQHLEIEIIENNTHGENGFDLTDDDVEVTHMKNVVEDGRVLITPDEGDAIIRFVPHAPGQFEVKVIGITSITERAVVKSKRFYVGVLDLEAEDHGGRWTTSQEKFPTHDDMPEDLTDYALNNKDAIRIDGQQNEYNIEYLPVRFQESGYHVMTMIFDPGSVSNNDLYFSPRLSLYDGDFEELASSNTWNVATTFLAADVTAGEIYLLGISHYGVCPTVSNLDAILPGDKPECYLAKDNTIISRDKLSASYIVGLVKIEELEKGAPMSNSLSVGDYQEPFGENMFIDFWLMEATEANKHYLYYDAVKSDYGASLQPLTYIAGTSNSYFRGLAGPYYFESFPFLVTTFQVPADGMYVISVMNNEEVPDPGLGVGYVIEVGMAEEVEQAGTATIGAGDTLLHSWLDASDGRNVEWYNRSYDIGDVVQLQVQSTQVDAVGVLIGEDGNPQYTDPYWWVYGVAESPAGGDAASVYATVGTTGQLTVAMTTGSADPPGSLPPAGSVQYTLESCLDDQGEPRSICDENRCPAETLTLGCGDSVSDTLDGASNVHGSLNAQCPAPGFVAGERVYSIDVPDKEQLVLSLTSNSGMAFGYILSGKPEDCWLSSCRYAVNNDYFRYQTMSLGGPIVLAKAAGEHVFILVDGPVPGDHFTLSLECGGLEDPSEEFECWDWDGDGVGVGSDCTVVDCNDYDPQRYSYCGDFTSIGAGSFWMGSPDGTCVADYPGGVDCVAEVGRETDEEVHYVELTHGFEMMTTEVTQRDFESLMGWNPSKFGPDGGVDGCGEDCPVESVTWYDAVVYANALSKREGVIPCYDISNVTCKYGGDVGIDYLKCYDDDATGGGVSFATVELLGISSVYDCDMAYRLPTEAEWEYAVRAGSQTAIYTTSHNDGTITSSICGSENLNEIAVFCGNDNNIPVPVASKEPNGWGLYDMSGNVWEWVWDVYEATYPVGTTASPVVDPTGSTIDGNRVYRGGSWKARTDDCRSANRVNLPPDFVNDGAGGFRLVRTTN